MTWWQRNGNTVLTVVSITGLFGTVISTARAAPKISKKIEKRRILDKDSTPKEKTIGVIKACFPECVTPLIFGSVTLASMIGCKYQYVSQQSSIAASYTMMKRLYDENRDKVKEVMNDICPLDPENPSTFDNVEESMNGDPKDRNDIFFLEYSGRRFKSNLRDVEEALKLASNDFDYMNSILFNEIYLYLGIAESKLGSFIGFNNSERMDDNNLPDNEQGPLYWEIMKVTCAEGINAEDAKKLKDEGKFIYMISFGNIPEDVSWDRCMEEWDEAHGLRGSL